VFVQAQTAGQHPWPIKEFFIDTDMKLQTTIRKTLASDFQQAARWYETMQFKSPELNRCVAGAPKKQKFKCGLGPVTSSCSAGDQYFIFGQENGMNHNGYAIIADEPSWDTNKPKPNGCLDKSEWDARDKAKGNCGKAWTAPGGYNNLDAIYFNEGDFSTQGMMRQANLPAHELFHAVTLAYPGYRDWFGAGGSKAGWLVEGLPDAMAWEWIRKGKYKSSISEKQILELSDPRDTQKGFRFYDYPLHMPLGFSLNKPPCGSDRDHLRKQEYRTWSFWRFLGRKKTDYELIREILEQTRGWDNLGLFVVDEVLRKATQKLCATLPNKDKKKKAKDRGHRLQQR
jgi:hypothetical protein